MIDLWVLTPIVAKFLVYLGTFVAAGAVFNTQIFRLDGFRIHAAIFACFGLLGAILSYMFGAATLTGEFSGMVDQQMLALLWNSVAGESLQTILLGLLLLLIGLPLGWVGRYLSSLGALLALFSFTRIGHIADQGDMILDVALLLHLFGAAFWIGILLPLRRLLTEQGDNIAAAEIGERFGKIAVVIVPIILLAGVVMANSLVGSIAALVTTPYGQTLLFKVVLVSALLALAAMNKLRFVPRLRQGDQTAAGQMSNVIRLEWIAFILIFVVTAYLTTTAGAPT